MKMIFNVDEIRVASPCHARWNDMDGDERARFCRQCSKHIFNLSAMTRAQIEALVREKEGKFCGRFHRRADGTMLTADCPSRMRQIRARVAKIGGALCALVLSLAGCSRQQTGQNGGRTGQVEMGDVVRTPAVGTTNTTPEIIGKIALPNPSASTNANPRVLMGEISVAPTDPIPPEK